MICKKCGAENPENFKFCQSCGSRLDGKKICTSCGAELDEDAKFCGVCGKSVNGINAVPEKTVAAEPDARQTTPAKAYDWKKIVNYVSFGFAGFAALIGFIFTFCIGVTGRLYVNNILYDSNTNTLYYYFFGVYEDMTSKTIYEWLPVWIKMGISAAALICGVVFAIITIVKCVKQFAHKKEGVNFVKPALLTYLSFALFASAFLAGNAYKYYDPYTSSITLSTVGFSAATLLGLILGGIAVGCYFVCKFVVRIGEYKNPKVIVNSSIALVIGVLSIAVAALLVSPVCSVGYAGSSSVTDAAGFLTFVVGAYRYYHDGRAALTASLGVVGFVIQILLLVFTVKVLYSSAKFAAEGIKGKTLGFAITNTVLSVAQLTVAVVLVNVLSAVYETEYTVSYAMPIAVLVLSVIVLAGTIVLKVLGNKKAKAEEPVEQLRF
ncbi:MAG: zinc-ribbon domain-containing protein [Clostridia bacterium]|nr:zinc-ribbon domain-containing protein [Clostridia bacterium]